MALLGLQPWDLLPHPHHRAPLPGPHPVSCLPPPLPALPAAPSTAHPSPVVVGALPLPPVEPPPQGKKSHRRSHSFTAFLRRKGSSNKSGGNEAELGIGGEAGGPQGASSAATSRHATPHSTPVAESLLPPRPASAVVSSPLSCFGVGARQVTAQVEEAEEVAVLDPVAEAPCEDAAAAATAVGPLVPSVLPRGSLPPGIRNIGEPLDAAEVVWLPLAMIGSSSAAYGLQRSIPTCYCAQHPPAMYTC